MSECYDVQAHSMKSLLLPMSLVLRAKFNDALNDQAAKVEHYIMMINSCNSFEHFDMKGHLSRKGKACFWWELDDLIEHFESNKVKLLPNPKNPPKYHRFARRLDTPRRSNSNASKKHRNY